MTSLPPGEWSLLLVGDQWPDDQDGAAIEFGKAGRGGISNNFSHFAEALRIARTGPLASQEGHTADDLRNAFRQGETDARTISEKNSVKENSYNIAVDSFRSLQQDLSILAREGNKEIKDIQDSKETVEAMTLQIARVISQYRVLAALAAAKYGGNVLEAVQAILNEEGRGVSARQFAQAQGVDVGQLFRGPISQTDLNRQIQDKLGSAGSRMGITGVGEASPEPSPQSHELGAPGSATAIGHGAEYRVPATTTHGHRAPGSTMKITGAAVSSPNFERAPLVPPSQPLIRPPGAPPVLANAFPRPSAPSLSESQLHPTVATPAPPTSALQNLTPNQLVQNFGKGLQTGAQFSAPTESVPVTPTSHVAPTSPAPPAAVPVVAHAAPEPPAPPPVVHAPVPEPPPIVAAQAQPPVTAAATPAGPLPAYASDLRPAVSTVQSGPPSLPPSVSPGSAPVHPSAGQTSPGHPTVVRNAIASKPTPPPSTLAAHAVVATTTGAAAGAASTNAAARARLHRLVAVVARQQPRLAWAAGDRDDGTTVLATDLAGGWIPPGIELPAAVTLLAPARRRGDLEALLGVVDVAIGYSPIHHVPEQDEPVPTSPRPRQAPGVDELGWELSQATQWRDGLPRLAHTLAKAASTGTGVLDSEVDLLHQHLAAISVRVLDSYPDRVDPGDIGNWQLLAAIDALVAGDKTAANYHLAWFQVR